MMGAPQAARWTSEDECVYHLTDTTMSRLLTLLAVVCALCSCSPGDSFEDPIRPAIPDRTILNGGVVVSHSGACSAIQLPVGAQTSVKEGLGRFVLPQGYYLGALEGGQLQVHPSASMSGGTYEWTCTCSEGGDSGSCSASMDIPSRTITCRESQCDRCTMTVTEVGEA